MHTKNNSLQRQRFIQNHQEGMVAFLNVWPIYNIFRIMAPDITKIF